MNKSILRIFAGISITVGATSLSLATTIFSTNSYDPSAGLGGEVTRFVEAGIFEQLANAMIEGAGAFLVGSVDLWDGNVEYYMLNTNSSGFPTDVLASGSGQSAQLRDTGNIIINGIGEPLSVYEITFELESHFQVPNDDSYAFGFRLTPEMTSIAALGFPGTQNELFHTPAGQFNWSRTEDIDQSLSFFFTGTIPEPSTGVLLISGAMLFFRRKRH